MTEISGWPASERSGSTVTRPARSSGAPRVAPSGEAATPAAQMTVFAARRSSPTCTPSASTPLTWRPSQTLDAQALELEPRFLPTGPAGRRASTRSPPSISTTRALRGS